MAGHFIAKSLVLLTAAFWVSVPALRHTTTGAGKSAAAPLLQTPSPTPIPRSNGSLPVVSPDGSRIAFVSDRNGADDVFVISVDGQYERQLISTPDAEGNVAWTREGKILFTVFRDGYSYLYSIDADGKNQHELAKVPGRGVTLSPDGQRLLYMAGTWTASKLTISAPDGSKPKEITDGSSIAWNSHWSPDGKQIAFTGRNGPKDELAIFIMSVDGSGRRQLTNIPPEEGGAQWPGWSPDGRQLAFQVNSRTQKGSAHIWIIDVRTGTARKLAAHAESYLDETPSWFPDGKRLAFQSNRTGRMEVWTIETDGSGARQVTGLKQDPTGQRAERHATLPVASGDGKRVLFTSERDSGLPQIYGINLDGSDEHRLTNLTTFDMAADCSRDGRWLSFLFLPSTSSPAQIGLMRADGSARRAVPAARDVRWPRISPDGKRIVFTAGNDKGESTIFIVNVDGTALKSFPSGLKQSWDPAWSPDGRRLAFSVYPEDFKHLDTMVSPIYVADVSGRNRRLLAKVPGLLQLARWSPDGKHLAYQTYTGGPDANLVLIEVVSGKVTTITHHEHPYLDEAPAWLPDGRLLFQSNRTGKFEVWMMNPDGSGKRQVTGR